MKNRETARIYHVYMQYWRIVSLVVKGKFGFKNLVAKYFENDYQQNLIVLFMSLLIAKFLKNIHIEENIYFAFLEKF